MYLDKGFVKITGSTDLEDSSMAAGLCEVFGYQLSAEPFDLSIYVGPDGMYRRCLNSKYSFSRDQFLCLAAGLFTQRRYSLVNEQRISGKDILSPSVHGHIRICQGLKPYWYQTLWFKLDLIFSAKFKPREELNQIFCQLMIHPDQSLLKWYCEMNHEWSLSIRDYFCNWREEVEFAEFMISKIHERINTKD